MGGQITINANWDKEAGVWWVLSEDVPGLVTEAETWDGLLNNIRNALTSLAQANELGLVGDVEVLTIARDTSNLRFKI